ncbi:TPA: TM2 domain-containing protein [Staphylococcus delphini]|nr:TM2 domain-containing protein [Staphylococcus delphini]HEC2181484.1 TM2 domain-containing protein [Staphylococcus delphini]HEC2222276.1 TM2 domain-containing protein [Staphylococcus delphini]HEC2229720.1 TM2 domain-containing protein [Staphylococcus delphini]
MKVNKITYVFFAFLLGGFGAHKFYINKKGLGFLYLLFCWTGVPGVIGIIEGIIAALKTSDTNGDIIV